MTAVFECPGCGIKIEDPPMSISTCVHCGEDLVTDGGAPPEPEGIPKYILEGLDKQGPETLRRIASYAEELADHREREQQRELEEQAVEEPDEAPDEWDQEEWDEVLDGVDAPTKATLTTKEIDGRQYFYYQWREGNKIKSEYVAPVSPSSN